jgi:hypothetical protein
LRLLERNRPHSRNEYIPASPFGPRMCLVEFGICGHIFCRSLHRRAQISLFSLRTHFQAFDPENFCEKYPTWLGLQTIENGDAFRILTFGRLARGGGYWRVKSQRHNGKDRLPHKRAFHKMKKHLPAVRLVGGCSRSRKLLNIKECFANVDAEKIRAGDSWVGVGKSSRLCNRRPPAANVRKSAKLNFRCNAL